jgi:Protein of unknown function (DUF3515)
VVSAAVLAACGGPGPVQVPTSAAPRAVRAQCSQLVAQLPQQVAGASRRDISPAGAPAGAWGDPAIVLRCGVGRPAALRATSYCFEIDHIGWLATQRGKAVSATSALKGTLDFTTIGRSVYVEVSVPDAYRPQADVLADLAASITKTTRTVSRCQ